MLRPGVAAATAPDGGGRAGTSPPNGPQPIPPPGGPKPSPALQHELDRQREQEKRRKQDERDHEYYLEHRHDGG